MNRNGRISSAPQKRTHPPEGIDALLAPITAGWYNHANDGWPEFVVRKFERKMKRTIHRAAVTARRLLRFPLGICTLIASCSVRWPFPTRLIGLRKWLTGQRP